MLLTLAAVVALPVAADAAKPHKKPDDSIITVSGTAVDTKDNRFTLDYGSGIIEVEVDDWDRYPEARPLIDGDTVTVHGIIDDDLYEDKTIEASSIYVQDLHTYLYANPVDEEDPVWIAALPIDPRTVSFQGTVKHTSPAENTLLLDTGSKHMKVGLAGIGYNAVDDLGFQQIDEGDIISVTGTMDEDVLTRRDLKATRVETIYED